MTSYHDTQLFITEIQNRPVLWDTSREDYKDKNKKTEAWIQVCRSLCTQYDEKNTTEKNKLERKAQSRWRSIRDSYMKYCKKLNSETQSRSGAVQSRRYIFSDHLSFLTKVTENKIIDSLSHAQDTQEMKEDVPQHLATPQPAPHSGLTKRKKTLHEEGMITSTKGAEGQDADRDFFMSMLPSVQTLNEEQKMEFRVQVIRVLQNIKSGRCEPSS